ncbi:MAG: Tex family protein [Desulfobacterales bacterium]|nr:Tex family protein [Desulfobacterales bacterium]
MDGLNLTHRTLISGELDLTEAQVAAVAGLLSQGATIPFMARYRKEATGSMDEVAIAAVRDRLIQLEELDARKASVLKSLEQNKHLNDDLQSQVLAAQTLAVLEDIYLPYRPKRRTRAMIAREKGLEPLALRIFEQKGIDPESAAAAYLDPEKKIAVVEDALSGARDIIAEMIHENAEARARLRRLFAGKGMLRSKVASGKETAAVKYLNYFDWQEPVARAPSHRVLAMRRGESEDLLNLRFAPAPEAAIDILEDLFLTGRNEDSRQVQLAIADGYKRLLAQSMETELRLDVKERADGEAIRIFAKNLRQLLLAPPLGPKRVLGVDPGFRTGCKIACLDRQGKLLHHDILYLHMSAEKTALAEKKMRDLCDRFAMEAIAVGNGTAGRETESFMRPLAAAGKIPVFLVNESGASVYSASEIARQEFPELDVTVRGAVSIARRLMDPLAELVKIDPKAIGVGQYQHDVDPSALKQALDDVVVSCVNAVGVDVNRASAQLLSYVSGLGPQLARNIVAYRDENGPFDSREALKKVPRLGPKAFEQSAGFLRITTARHPLDASAVHPESYHLVEAMARDAGCSVADLMSDAGLRAKIALPRYVSQQVGLPTLNDIVAELAKPGRDPRETVEVFTFAEGVEKITDLAAGMRLPGIVTNITAFGAFVDVGVHQDGLVHISELSDRYVKDPNHVVKLQQKVMVIVLGVDLGRRRITLSMKTPAAKSPEL